MNTGKFKLFSLVFWCLIAASLLGIGLQSSQHNKNSSSASTTPSERAIDGKAEKLALPAFLDKYEQNSGIKVHREVKIPNDVYVSAHLLNLPPEEALLKALTDFSVLLAYAAHTEQHPHRLKEAWIYSPKQNLSSADAKAANTPPPLTQTNRGPLKAEDVVDIIARGDEDAERVIEQALQDGDETVRYRTLVAASEAGAPLSSSMLIRMLQTDPSDTVRGAALNALQKNHEIDDETFNGLLNWAAIDPSPYVQNRALTILSEMESHTAR